MMEKYLIDIAQQIVNGTWPATQNNIDMLEHAIAEHGLRAKYVGALGDVLWGGWGVNQEIDYDWMWDFLRATPVQKAQAFLMVTQ